MHFPGLDGLRALAFLLVFSVHLTPTFIDRWGPVTGGYLGLDLFFVLSGFLITTILVSEYARHGDINLKKFYLRRTIRLLPVLVLFVAAVFLVTSFDPVFKSLAGDSRRHALASLTYFYNWFAMYSTNRGGNVGYVGSLWSLSVEEQFYLIFPACLLFGLRYGTKRSKVTTDQFPLTTETLANRLRSVVKTLFIALIVSNVLIVLIGFVFEGPKSYNRAMWGTDTRSSGFVLGALTAIARIAYPQVYSRLARHSSWAATLAALYFTVACFKYPGYPGTFPFTGGLLIADICVVILIIAAVEGRPKWILFILQQRPLRWIGKVSYSAYVVHYMLVWRFYYQDKDFFRFAFPPILAMTLAIAAVSFYLIEQPLSTALRRRWKLN